MSDVMPEVVFATTDQSDAQLSIGDVAATVRVIDAVAERGAFKGPELETIGQLRGRLAEFVNANSPQPEATEEEAA